MGTISHVFVAARNFALASPRVFYVNPQEMNGSTSISIEIEGRRVVWVDRTLPPARRRAVTMLAVARVRSVEGAAANDV